MLYLFTSVDILLFLALSHLSFEPRQLDEAALRESLAKDGKGIFVALPPERIPLNC